MSAAKKKGEPAPSPEPPPVLEPKPSKWSVETSDMKTVDLEQKVAALLRVLTKIARSSEASTYVVIKAMSEQFGMTEWVTAQLGSWGMVALKAESAPPAQEPKP